MLYLKNTFILFLCLFVLSACKDTNSSESSKEDANTTDNTYITKEKEEDIIIYAWVNNLRVRAQPDTKSKIITELAEGDSLVYLKEKTDFTQKISLRGKLWDEPWLKVKTRQNKTGWVYGGGVKFYAPKGIRKPRLYDKCYAYLEAYREVKFQGCFEEVQAKQLKKTQGIVESTPRGLSLRLLSGEKIFLENIADSIHYRFFYYYPKMSSFVVQVWSGNDADYFLLINDKSGKKTKLWGYPKPSPENKQWLSSFVGERTPGFYGGIQVLAYTDKGLEVVWEKELREEPHVPYWLDEETIEYTAKKRGSSKTFVRKLKIGD